jgi:predicted phosphodiesterase
MLYCSHQCEHGHEHGWKTPSHKSLLQTYPNAKVIIYGHTHKQVIDTESSPWVINPGASGAVRNGEVQVFQYQKI